MQVLNQYQIREKIIRLSYEILENNLEEDIIVLVGINDNGVRFADLLANSLRSISSKLIILNYIKFKTSQPLLTEIDTDLQSSNVMDKAIILVDDVANTGKTIFYAFKVFMDVFPKKLEVAVLVDRKHKLFPIKVDYVGLSLATTMQEHIKADLSVTDDMSVVLM